MKTQMEYIGEIFLRIHDLVTEEEKIAYLKQSKSTALINVLVYAYSDKYTSSYKEIPKYIQQKLSGFVEKKDTATVNKLISIAYLYDNYKPDSAVIYALKSLAISKKINYEYGITYSYQVLVNKNRDNGDLPAALNYANTQFRYVQEIKDTLKKNFCKTFNILFV